MAAITETYLANPIFMEQLDKGLIEIKKLLDSQKNQIKVKQEKYSQYTTIFKDVFEHLVYSNFAAMRIPNYKEDKLILHWACYKIICYCDRKNIWHMKIVALDPDLELYDDIISDNLLVAKLNEAKRKLETFRSYVKQYEALVKENMILDDKLWELETLITTIEYHSTSFKEVIKEAREILEDKVDENDADEGEEGEEA